MSLQGGCDESISYRYGGCRVINRNKRLVGIVSIKDIAPRGH